MSATGERILALGRAARVAFAQGDIEEGAMLIEERGRAIQGLTALEIGHGTLAQLQSEEPELRRSAEAARDAIADELRRATRPHAYPLAG